MPPMINQNKFPFAPWVFIAGFILSTSAWAGAMEHYPAVKIRALDKVTARAVTMELPIGDTIEFGTLYIKAKACRKAEPIEQPESASFLQIWEFPINKEKSRRNEEPIWVYSGWMFASSPGLSSMDHPIYDIWVLDCVGDPEPIRDEDEDEEEEN